MRPQFFGDSYDIVKQSLIDWLSGFGEWLVHPMFTVSVSRGAATEFSRFLGATLLSVDVLTPETDRSEYFTSCHKCGHLLLDPDIGLRIKRTAPAQAPSYLFGAELISMVRARPNSLTLVFDQSVARGAERSQIEQKLSHLLSQGIHGLAYVSHACFVLVGLDGALIDKAYQRIRKESRLPLGRLVKLNAAYRRVAAEGALVGREPRGRQHYGSIRVVRVG